MKKSHKKIGAVVLTGLAVTGSGFSQGFVANADSSRLLNQHLIRNYNSFMSMEDIGNLIQVKASQNNHGYDALFLGNSGEFDKFISRRSSEISYDNHKYRLLYPKMGTNNRHPFLDAGIDKYFCLEFKDEYDFLEKLDRGVLNPYKRKHDVIIVKVGTLYFKFYFRLTEHQRNVIPIKYLAPQYGFRVEYSDENGWYGKIVTLSHLQNRNDLKNDPQLRNQLEKEPNIKHIFPDAETFAILLNVGEINIPPGLSRYRIGGYDFILRK